MDLYKDSKGTSDRKVTRGEEQYIIEAMGQDKTKRSSTFSSFAYSSNDTGSRTLHHPHMMLPPIIILRFIGCIAFYYID